MTNITPIFDQILVKNGGQPPEKRATSLSLNTVDDFLEEAYKINSQIASLHAWLRNIRRSYLSTSPPSSSTTTSTQPTRHHRAARDGSSITTSQKHQHHQAHLTNQDREQIDINAKAMLRELHAKIQNMNAAEGIRHDTYMAIIAKKHRSGLGALGTWAAGGSDDAGGGFAGLGAKSEAHRAAEDAEKGVATHRSNVVVYLRERLQDCLMTQTNMMEIRITREKEKAKSVLAKAGRGFVVPDASWSTTTAVPRGGGDNEGNSRAAYRPEDELSSEQIQMFEKQNQELLRQDESTLNQVRTAERSLVEIAELQQELINNLTVQSEHIEQLVSDSFATTENVGGGNKELQKATERPSTARRLFFSTSAFCAFLIVWDLIF